MPPTRGERPDWAQVQPILEVCVGLSEEERASYLQETCGPDTAQYVLRLLEAEEQANESEFLFAPDSEDLAGPRAGTTLGPWRLVERIGEGGMGLVWLGERADGEFEKRVAIKLLKVGMRLSALRRRFRTEVQVLASLEHPSIARFYDGGRTPEGVPYLVLEYVDGESIDRWCDTQRLGIRERIELFLGVCDAVQHAHERGVLHRDLKPGNVLVAQDGAARLLDFGIAKVVGELDGVETLEMTRTGQRLYSPRYASPEQVRGEETSATSDVYSLGVMLYELLTGRPPYSLTKISQFELERAALETDALRPSHAIRHPLATDDPAGADAAPTWSLRGLSDSREHRKRLSGDLDWILLTALRKDSTRRYATVHEFAEDLRRHVDRLPVRARPESRLYRAKRFVQRNRILVASSLAVLAALVAGLVLALASSERANRASEENRRTAYRSAMSAAAAGLDTGAVRMAAGKLQEQPADLRGWEWQHLMSRSDRSLAHFAEATSQVEGSGVVLAPDGSWAAVAERGITWIDLEEGVVLGTTALSSSPVTSALSIHPDGSLVVAGTPVGHLVTLNANSREVVRVDEVSETVIEDVAFSPSGKLLAYADDSGFVSLLEEASRAVVHKWQAHKAGDVGLHFSPAGARLATTSWDGSAKIWDARTAELLATCEGHERWVTDAEWTSSGDRLVTTSTDGTVAVWDADSGARLAAHALHSGLVTSVVVLPGNEEAVSTGFAGEVLRWNLTSGTLLARFVGHQEEVAAIQWDARRERLVTAGHDGTRIWPVDTADRPTGEACEYSRQLAVAPGGSRVVCLGADGILRFFTPRGVEIERRPSDRPSALPRGHGIAMGWVEERVATLNLEPGGYVLHQAGAAPLPIHDGPASVQGTLLCWAPATDQIVALAPYHNQLIDRATGERTRLEHEGTELILGHASALSPDGRLLAAGGLSGLHLWTLPAGVHEREITLPEEGEAPQGLAFDPDGTHLLVATGRGLLVYAIDADEPPRLLEGTAQARTLAYHPSEPRIAVGHSDGRVTLLDSAREEVLVTLGRHTGVVTNLAFTPDGSALISLGAEGTVRFWTRD